MRLSTPRCLAHLALGAGLLLSAGPTVAQAPVVSSGYSAGSPTSGVTAGSSTASRTYTLDADFDEGVLVNLNHDTPNNDQLQLNEGTAAFPFVNIAASSRGTIIRTNTETGEITGEYFTSPAGQAKNPSRTTVDAFGNVWVGNRNARFFIPGEDNARGSLTRVGLIVGGTRTDAGGTPDANGQYVAGPYDYNTCVDSDGDGLIKTSRGLGNYLPWTNAGAADTGGGTSTAEDECILNYTIAGGPNTRTITIDQNNDVWVGGTGSVSGGRLHEKVDGTTGARVVGSAFTFPCGGYGGFIDGNNVLWSMTSSSTYLRYDLTAGTGSCISLTNYGTGVDPATGEIWISQLSGANGGTPATRGTIHKVAPDGTLIATYNHGSPNAQGVVVDADGNVWVAHSLFNATTVGHIKTDGTFVGNVTLPSGNGPTGVAIDADGKVWVANINTSNAMRIDPDAGPIGADGVTRVGAVDLTVDLNMAGLPNAGPYNYSDMTGSVVSGTTAPSGTWTVVHDGTAADVAWSAVSWTADVQAGQSVTVEVRAANAPGDLGSASFTPVSNGTPLAGVVGRYLEVRATLARSASPTSPVLFDLTVVAPDDPGGDTTPPVCGPIVIDRATGNGVVSTTATDETGIVRATWTTLTNLVGELDLGGGVVIGPSSQGDIVDIAPTASIGISAERVDPAVAGAVIVVRVEDAAGNSADCDPVVAALGAAPEALTLDQNRPNPLTRATSIPFGLAESGPVRLAVYDILGREVAVLVDRTMGAGAYEVSWDGADAFGRTLASGTYVYRLTAGPRVETRRMTIVR